MPAGGGSAAYRGRKVPRLEGRHRSEKEKRGKKKRSLLRHSVQGSQPESGVQNGRGHSSIKGKEDVMLSFQERKRRCLHIFLKGVRWNLLLLYRKGRDLSEEGLCACLSHWAVVSGGGGGVAWLQPVGGQGGWENSPWSLAEKGHELPQSGVGSTEEGKERAAAFDARGEKKKGRGWSVCERGEIHGMIAPIMGARRKVAGRGSLVRLSAG